ncbi:MAG: tyrosine-type recombinase/integrase [Bacteroidales bacterium]|nr:tyrosine-type recombinase/integrase [Bacteroidales bacterium]
MITNFYLDNKADRHGNKPIMVSLSTCGARHRATIGIKVNPGQWNPDKQRPKKGAANKAEIERAIKAITAHFSTYEETRKLENEKRGKEDREPITSADLKAEWSKSFSTRRSKAPDEKAAPLTIGDVIKLFVEAEGNLRNWTDGTKDKFHQLDTRLSGCFKNASLEVLDKKGLTKFVAFLRDVMQYKNTTLGKTIALLKWFLRWAVANGYHRNSDFASFSPKFTTAGKKVVYLEWDELMRTFDFEIPDNGTEVELTDSCGRSYTKIVEDAPAIRRSRDIFCFCATTSLRFSDAVNLKWSDIDLASGSFTITTKKTADTIIIDLNKYSLRILEKYRQQDNGGFVFPSITNQRMNIYLKDLFELMEINQPITDTYYIGSKRFDETRPKYEYIGTHTARRTFICHALMMGIPCDVVMKWTGHSDYKAMKPYIAIADSAKKKEMLKFDER